MTQRVSVEKLTDNKHSDKQREECHGNGKGKAEKRKDAGKNSNFPGFWLEIEEKTVPIKLKRVVNPVG